MQELKQHCLGDIDFGKFTDVCPNFIHLQFPACLLFRFRPDPVILCRFNKAEIGETHVLPTTYESPESRVKQHPRNRDCKEDPGHNGKTAEPTHFLPHN